MVFMAVEHFIKHKLEILTLLIFSSIFYSTLKKGFVLVCTALPSIKLRTY